MAEYPHRSPLAYNDATMRNRTPRLHFFSTSDETLDASLDAMSIEAAEKSLLSPAQQSQQRRKFISRIMAGLCVVLLVAAACFVWLSGPTPRVPPATDVVIQKEPVKPSSASVNTAARLRGGLTSPTDVPVKTPELGGGILNILDGEEVVVVGKTGGLDKNLELNVDEILARASKKNSDQLPNLPSKTPKVPKAAPKPTPAPKVKEEEEGEDGVAIMQGEQDEVKEEDTAVKEEGLLEEEEDDTETESESETEEEEEMDEAGQQEEQDEEEPAPPAKKNKADKEAAKDAEKKAAEEKRKADRDAAKKAKGEEKEAAKAKKEKEDAKKRDSSKKDKKAAADPKEDKAPKDKKQQPAAADKKKEKKAAEPPKDGAEVENDEAGAPKKKAMRGAQGASQREAKTADATKKPAAAGARLRGGKE